MMRTKQIADLMAYYPDSVRMPPNPEKPGREEIKVPLKLSVS
jgi:hypothetical protein